jgi:hypothetical protein
MRYTCSLPLLLVLIMAALPGCSRKKASELSTYEACPKPTIVRQLSRHKILSQDQNPQLKVIWTLERVAKTSCEVKRFGSHLAATVRLSATKGPAFPAGQTTVNVPYFMVVRDGTGQIIDKTNRVVTLTFDSPEESYASLTDTISITGLPQSTDNAFESLSFMLGLQADPQE